MLQSECSSISNSRSTLGCESLHDVHDASVQLIDWLRVTPFDQRPARTPQSVIDALPIIEYSEQTDQPGRERDALLELGVLEIFLLRSSFVQATIAA